MATSGVNSNTSTSSSTSSTMLGGKTAQEVQDQFMTLLIEQLKNQDPLNPMDNAEMTSQMSQISMVSGIQQLNSSMTSLTSSMLSSQTSQAISLMGKSVAVPGSSLNLTTDGTTSQANGAFWLNSAADNTTVTIQDADGNTVKTLNFTGLNAGMQNFTWDGVSDNGVTEPAGNYTMSVGAVQGTQTVDSQALQWGTVGRVEQDASGGWSVTLNGSNTPVSISNVRSVVGS